MKKTGSLDETSIQPEAILQNKEAFLERGVFFDAPSFYTQKRPSCEQKDVVALAVNSFFVLQEKKVFFNSLNLTFYKGGITALVGACGEGKTTLLLALANIGKHTGTYEAKGRVGLVFQNPRFQFLTLSVKEEVKTSLALLTPNASEKALESETDRLLETFALSSCATRSPYELSQGQQRRLALLSMIACGSDILLLDEPTYAQDERATGFILNLLEKQVQKGMTVIMATHDLALAKSYADHILLIKDHEVTPLAKEAVDTHFGGAS